MTNEQKIRLADLIINFLSENMISPDHPRMVGTLNKELGMKGFKIAEIDTPVFEYKDRYLIYLIREDDNLTVEVPYYKETLKPAINFLNK